MGGVGEGVITGRNFKVCGAEMTSRGKEGQRMKWGRGRGFHTKSSAMDCAPISMERLLS